jgi:hypothetical protein
MQMGTRTLIATAAAALGMALVAAPATANDDLKVVAGKSINGISLGDTAKEVRKSTPLGLKKPSRTAVSEIAGVGKLLSETYMAGALGNTLVVSYLVPSKSKKKKGKKKKKKDPKVVLVSTGAGYWTIFGTGIFYGAGTGSSPAQVGEVFPCSFYTKYSGPRDYADVTASDAQYCELVQAQDAYFYFTFNNGYTFGDPTPAILAGFTLSRVQIP